MGNILFRNEDYEYPREDNWYGWVRDRPDRKNILYKDETNIKTDTIPDNLSLIDKCPPVYTQEALGSCTSQAIAFAYQYDEMKQKNTCEFMPSRLFIYYNERKMEGHTKTDSGAEIKDGIKCINRIGVCDEKMWKYDINRFTEEPPEECYTEAMNYHSVKYMRLHNNLDELKHALNNNFPVVFGFIVYESFESESVEETGMMPYPEPDEQILGGHAVALVGYDDNKESLEGEKGMFIVRNSWGEEWGDKGYFYMPYKFILDGDLASDFWVVESVTNPDNWSKLE